MYMDVSKTYKLLDLAEYSEGSIVSRTLLKSKSGNITFFAFAKGQGLSEHTAPFNAFVHILDGVAQVKIGNEVFNVSAGEVIILPANIAHALQAIENFKMALIMIRDKEN
ncbi:MAG: cupin domain-containing protein [Cyclobacteriaceae bacterium]|nr:cupin domain-containing protein [Cyclobacteriaceae bacterium]